MKVNELRATIKNRKKDELQQLIVIMEIILKDQFNQTLTASDLVEVLEAMGYLVMIEKRPALTPEQRQYASKRIFSEPDVIRQIDKAK